MIHLSIATPEKVAYEDEIYSVTLPGFLGYMQILPNHAELITSLRAGTVTLVSKNHEKISYQISGGFFEFSKNRGALLADSIKE